MGGGGGGGGGLIIQMDVVRRGANGCLSQGLMPIVLSDSCLTNPFSSSNSFGMERYAKRLLNGECLKAL